jgi:hypothetical protein
MADLFPSEDIVDPTKNYLEELVGEGKKFADPVALARAKAESDAYIARLEKETAGLRDELGKRMTLEEAVAKIEANRKSDLPDGDRKAPEGDTAQMSPTELAAYVQEQVSAALTKSTQSSRADANVTEAVNELRKKFGDNFQTVVEAKRKELGLGKEFMTDLAATQPKAFLALVGAAQTRSVDVLPASSVNTATFQGRNLGERTKKYFDEIKAKDPTLYWSPKVQNEMHQQAIKLREKFYE